MATPARRDRMSPAGSWPSLGHGSPPWRGVACFLLLSEARQETRFATLPLLCIVIGLSWADFWPVYLAPDGVSRVMLLKAAIASSLLLSALALVSAAPDMLTTSLLLLLSLSIAGMAHRRLSSPLSLTAAGASFACYFIGSPL
ncbi:hypothetical protein SAMN05880582_108147 [Rhizobium sp. RU20A]|uniref:hypothetical protein n=1 Tax=Rhizobium sp. RU20A TaxID=1907412 RepID=UPI000954F3DC|nr:hypothetical protein [Rhizobium sp. RU20A]SIR24751.1 hypothetical protein SAMN05880582_108147 [Rhizobium sp. RU20A]